MTVVWRLLSQITGFPLTYKIHPDMLFLSTLSVAQSASLNTVIVVSLEDGFLNVKHKSLVLIKYFNTRLAALKWVES